MIYKIPQWPPCEIQTYCYLLLIKFRCSARSVSLCIHFKSIKKNLQLTIWQCRSPQKERNNINVQSSHSWGTSKTNLKRRPYKRSWKCLRVCSLPAEYSSWISWEITLRNWRSRNSLYFFSEKRAWTQLVQMTSLAFDHGRFGICTRCHRFVKREKNNNNNTTVHSIPFYVQSKFFFCCDLLEIQVRFVLFRAVVNIQLPKAYSTTKRVTRWEGQILLSDSPSCS